MASGDIPEIKNISIYKNAIKQAEESRRKLYDDRIARESRQMRKEMDQELAAAGKNEKKIAEIRKKYLDMIDDYKQRQEEEFSDYRKQLYKKDSDENIKIIESANKAAEKSYAKLMDFEKTAYKKQKLEELKERRKAEKEELASRRQLADLITSQLSEATISEDLKKDLEQQLSEINANIAIDEESLAKMSTEIKAVTQDFINSVRDNAAASVEDISAAIEESKKKAKSGEGSAKDNKKELKELRDQKAKKEVADQREADKEKKAEDKAKAKAEARDKIKSGDFATEALQRSLKNLGNVLADFTKSIDSSIEDMYGKQAQFEARLQGAEGQSYSNYMDNIRKTIGINPFLSQKKMVENLQKLIDSGVSYNAELRAYIATVSENIASTFDAFDSNLLRLIRIQQNDSTAARLGIEASLTKLFNEMYSDTSYLGQSGGGGGIYDQVLGAITEASALMTHDMAVEFEYVVQKWLGALYSVGLSDNTVNTIAQGINLLGTGNIEQLSSNDALMSLMAMSASKSGTSISDLLNGGLTAETTNKLLSGMVEYLATIAENTDANNITKASYANIFGISNTDFRAISNIMQDVNTLTNTTMSYSGALKETTSQLSQVSSRMSVGQIVNNLIENATTASALGIGSSTGSYGLWKALNIVQGLTGGIEIPAIQAMGFGLASEIDILQIAKMAMAGGSLLSSLISGLSNGSGGGLPGLSAWAGYEQAVKRGTGLKSGAGINQGFSQSATTAERGSSSSDDVTKSSMSDATESAKENQSEEDKEAADKTEKFQDKTLSYLDTITGLLAGTYITSANSANIISTVKNINESTKIADIMDSTGKPLPVILSAASGETAAPIPVNLMQVDSRAEITLKQVIQSLLGGSIEGVSDLNNDQQNNIVDLIINALNNSASSIKVNVTNADDFNNPFNSLI